MSTYDEFGLVEKRWVPWKPTLQKPTIVSILEAHLSILGQAIRRCHRTPRLPLDDDMLTAVVDALRKRGWSAIYPPGHLWTHAKYPGKHNWSDAFRIEFPP